jgi:hypothetical protein
MEIISENVKKNSGVLSITTTFVGIPKTNGNVRNAAQVFTTKRNKTIISRFQFGDYSNSQMFNDFTFVMFQDRSGTILETPCSKVTEKAIKKEHSAAIAKFMEIMNLKTS